MYNTVISKFNFHRNFDLEYTDTDSLTMKQSTWQQLREMYPINAYEGKKGTIK